MQGEDVAYAFVEVRGEASPGLPMIEACKERAADMPVVVLSSNEELPRRMEAKQAGADDFLATPVLGIDLAMRLSQLEETERVKRLLRAQAVAPLALAGLDVLTGLPGAGALQDHLDREYARARRYGHVLTVLMLGLDRLGPYNKKYGQEAGDRALRLLADVLRSALRSPDIVARHTGDHFVVLATDTNQEQGVLLGNRLRAALRVESRHASLPGLTVSIGVASSKAVEVSRALDLMGAAARSLALAKAEGRNRCHAEP
jgi:diguanylate cyclase (GGDEF)-like protein